MDPADERDALRAENARLRERLRPVPFTERKPQERQQVLMWSSLWCEWRVKCWMSGEAAHYTHWLPLPEDVEKRDQRR